MDWSFSARFVCSLTVSNAFQSSLRVLELMLEHAAACSSFIKFLTSTRPKASETSGGVFVETRNTKAVSRSSLPSQGNPICLNKWCIPLNPVEPRWTPLHHWAGSMMVYKGDPVTMLLWSVFDPALWGNQRRFCGAVQGCSSRDALCNESRLSSLDIGNAKELTMASTDHSDSCHRVNVLHTL